MVCVYSRTVLSVLVRRTRFVCILELSSQCLSVLVRRTRFVCILELSSQCLSEEDTVCVYSRPQFSVS